MVGILLNSRSPKGKENSNDLHLSLGFVLGERRRDFERAARGQLELLMDGTVLRRMQGAMSYKVRTGLDVNKEVDGNP